MTEKQNRNRSRRIRAIIFIAAMIALAVALGIVLFLQTGDGGTIWAPGPIGESPGEDPTLPVL